MNEIIKKIDEEIERLNDKRNKLHQAHEYQASGVYISKIATASKIKAIIQAEQKDVCHDTKDCEFKIDKFCELGSPCPHQSKPKNNGDLIRQMDNEELANWIFEKIEDVEWDEDGNNNYEDDIAEWLDEVVGERN